MTEGVKGRKETKKTQTNSKRKDEIKRNQQSKGKTQKIKDETLDNENAIGEPKGGA